MRLGVIADTHAFVWYVTNRGRLSVVARDTLDRAAAAAGAYACQSPTDAGAEAWKIIRGISRQDAHLSRRCCVDKVAG